MTKNISCADYAFPLLDHDAVLDLIRAMGFSGVNVALFAGRSHLLPEQCLQSPQKYAELLVKKCRERDLEIAELFLTPGRDVMELALNAHSAGERQKSRDCFLRTLDFADYCQPACLDILPGINWEGKESDAWECCVEELNWRVDAVGDRPYTLTVEPHVGSIVESPSRVLKLLDEVEGLRLSLDYAHFCYQGYSDEEVDVLLPHARHLHARGASEGMIQAIEAENTIDYRRIGDLFFKQCPSDWICVEYVWMDKWDCNRVDNVSESILLRNLLLDSTKAAK